jgi:hypothetical protein
MFDYISTMLSCWIIHGFVDLNKEENWWIFEGADFFFFVLCAGIDLNVTHSQPLEGAEHVPTITKYIDISRVSKLFKKVAPLALQ